ncbi:pimeloyl-ACP methyl esterase BioG family protein [Helicobacter sp. UBA3407]|uniref:pimeloyl-ACP methyl esterase BioG family protein n=1 Tax=Helicobacter TaxID=209 RepID=UPI0026123B3D|nr:pimeloyl-ACP methyl esterase BioG family protein [Helicobacter sp. UBA3407]
MNIYQKINNNENILLIFGGFASHPSHFLPLIPAHYDFILLSHYQHLDFSVLKSLLQDLNKESKITLLAFSMGVFVARVFMESSQDFNCFARKIAINGTEFGMHSKFGIPPKIFKLTQKTFNLTTFKHNLFGKFFNQTHNFEFLDSNILREELGFFIQACLQFDTITSEIFWDEILISKQDLVFNTQSQKNFWIDFKGAQERILEIDAPHFAFFDWQP